MDVRVVNVGLAAAERGGRWRYALALYSALVASRPLATAASSGDSRSPGIEPDGCTLSTLITSLVRTHPPRWRRALALLDAAPPELARDRAARSASIMGCGRGGAWRVALRIYGVRDAPPKEAATVADADGAAGYGMPSSPPAELAIREMSTMMHALAACGRGGRALGLLLSQVEA